MYKKDLFHRNSGASQELKPEQIADSLRTRIKEEEKTRSIQRINYEHRLNSNMIGESIADITDSGVFWLGFLPHEGHHYTGETRDRIGLLAHLQIYQDLAGRKIKGYLVKERCKMMYTSLIEPCSYNDFLKLLKRIGVNHRMQFKDCLERLVAACEQEKLI